MWYVIFSSIFLFVYLFIFACHENCSVMLKKCYGDMTKKTEKISKSLVWVYYKAEWHIIILLFEPLSLRMKKQSLQLKTEQQLMINKKE